MIEFKKAKEYQEQGKDIMAAMQAAKARRDSALELVHALKADYEGAIRKSFEAGADATAELDSLSDKIEAAERAFKRRESEYAHVTATQTQKVKPDDVIAAWNTEFIPKFKESLYDPAIQALIDAKLAYVSAWQTYRGVVKQFDGIKGDALAALGGETTVGSRYRYKLKDVDFETPAQSDPYYITGTDLHYLLRDMNPVSIQYVERGGGK